MNGKIPPHDRALEEIEYLIVSKHLRVGDKLPSERDMCEMWNVSRTALRSAISDLCAQHILESRPGSGTYILPPRPVSVFEGNEGFSENVRSVGMVPSSRVLSASVRVARQHVAKRMSLKEDDLIFEFRRIRYVNGLPCMVETSKVNYALCPGIERFDFANESLFDVMAKEYSCYPAGATGRFSMTHMDDFEAVCLDCEVGAVAFYESGVSRTASGDAFEYYTSVIRPDRYTFASMSDNLPREAAGRWLGGACV
jgi:GntR family transcriptional regulator